jgi:deazaflavin-dependent oxidoreductase (nitroreductase family)
MTFEKTPRGTYGQKMPSFAVPLMKMLNPLMRWQVRRGGHSAGMSLVALTTTGAKSGQRREVILGALPDGDGAWLIAASAGGAAVNPAWYHNLAAHPDQAELVVGRDAYAVDAAQLTGAQRDAAWDKIVAAGSRYAGYVPKTDRVIPVLRLTTKS